MACPRARVRTTGGGQRGAAPARLRVLALPGGAAEGVYDLVLVGPMRRLFPIVVVLGRAAVAAVQLASRLVDGFFVRGRLDRLTLGGFVHLGEELARLRVVRLR